jgi:hypothetical protein
MTASPAPSSASQPQAQATYINPADDPVPQDSRKRIEYAARLLKKVTSLPKVSPQLTGASNYRQWRENMVNMLDINFLMEIVTGEIVEPPRGHDLRFDWERLCMIAGTAIVNNVVSSINEKINRMAKTPKSAWELLEMQYAVPDAHVAQKGFTKAMNLRLSTCSSITDYCNQVESAWEDVFSGWTWCDEWEHCRCLNLLAGIDSEDWLNWKTSFFLLVKQSKNPRRLYNFRKIVSALL